MQIGIRSWHTWVSVVLCVPIVLVSATAILIAHDDGLGTKSIPVAGLTSPEQDMSHGYELKSYAELTNGQRLFGTRHGLIVSDPGAEPALASELGSGEVRDIAEIDGSVFVATQTGLWRRSADGAWARAAKGDFWSVSANGDTVLAVSKKQGLLRSADGGQTLSKVETAHATLRQYDEVNGPPPYTLNKLVMDIHTGKLFFGKEYEWIWIDLIGGVMVFLTISGLIMWRRAERRKLEMIRPTTSLSLHQATG